MDILEILVLERCPRVKMVIVRRHHNVKGIRESSKYVF